MDLNASGHLEPHSETLSGNNKDCLGWQKTAQIIRRLTNRVQAIIGRRLRLRFRLLRPNFSLVAVVLVLIAATALGIYRLCAGTVFEETDDAYLTGHGHQISSRIENIVQAVLVDDNDYVKKGQTLVLLDPHDYLVELEKAEARFNEAMLESEKNQVETVYSDKNACAESAKSVGEISAAFAEIEQEKAQIKEAEERIESAKAGLAEAVARLTKATLDCERFTKLEERGVVSTQQKEHAISDFEVCKAAVQAKRNMIDEARAKLDMAKSAQAKAQARLKEALGDEQKAVAAHMYTRVAEGQVKVSKAKVMEARSAVAAARLKVAYCTIRSPVAGRIGKRTVEIGHRIEPGQQLMHVVEDYVWIVANFKETQMKKIAPGQVATIKIDSIPGKSFIGYVDSFSPGSGAFFALLPPDNATGNFTKIVQRVPVKIRFDESSIRGYRERLSIGESALVRVYINDSAGADKLAHLRSLDDPQKKCWEGDSGVSFK